MSSIAARWNSSAPYLRSILRAVAAFMFTLAGTSKLFGFPAATGHGHLPPEILVAGVLEIVGGGLLLIGLLTRPVAFLLAGEMAVAYFQVHFPKSFWPTVNGGVPAVLYSFVFLYLSAAGAGPWSLDALLKRRRSRSLA